MFYWGMIAATFIIRSVWNMNSYNDWNMNYVSGFQIVNYFPKLAIPSVLCASDANVVEGEGWRRPDPKAWLTARAVPLKAGMVFVTSSKLAEQAAGNATPSMKMHHDARQAWGKISRGYSNLPRPPDCCQDGSLKAMWDHVKPYDPLMLSPTRRCLTNGLLSIAP